MNGTFSITVPGVPVAKGRPRFTKSGRSYTPGKTRAYERLVAMEAKLAMVGHAPLEGPLRAIITAWLPIPKSWNNKKTIAAEMGEMTPAGKPDLDNFIKAALDGLNGIVFEDDSQVVRIAADKKYSPRPRLEIVITEEGGGRHERT